jgi:Icc-related predicted phosphoesterase
MRVLAFSDLHGSRSKAAEIVAASAGADLVIGAGDFCNMRKGLPEAMETLKGLQAPAILVPGNAESADELRAAAPWATVLHGQGVTIGGVDFFGLGYGVPTTPFGSWSCDLSETEAVAMLAPLPEGAVLILHSPPKGVADRTSAGQSVGSTAIRAAIEAKRPRLAVCGHIHDSWGAAGRIGPTEVRNLGPTPNWFEISPESPADSPQTPSDSPEHPSDSPETRKDSP